MANNLIATTFDDVGELPPPRSQRQQQNGKQEKTPNRFWVNVGVVRTSPTGEETLISLPMGIALDKLKTPEVPKSDTKNPEFRYKQLAKVQLWKKMQEVMATMKPGEERNLPFTVQIRMTEEGESLEAALSEENPFSLDDLKL